MILPPFLIIYILPITSHPPPPTILPPLFHPPPVTILPPPWGLPRPVPPPPVLPIFHPLPWPLPPPPPPPFGILPPSPQAWLKKMNTKMTTAGRSSMATMMMTPKWKDETSTRSTTPIWVGGWMTTETEEEDEEEEEEEKGMDGKEISWREEMTTTTKMMMRGKTEGTTETRNGCITEEEGGKKMSTMRRMEGTTEEKEEDDREGMRRSTTRMRKMEGTTQRSGNTSSRKMVPDEVGHCVLGCLRAMQATTTSHTMSPQYHHTSPTKNVQQSTTSEPYYYEYEADEEISQFGICNTTIIREPAQRIVFHVLFYIGAGWTPFWALLSMVVNLAFRQFGHHRGLDAFQELGFVLLFPFLGVFTLFPKLELLCLITTLVLQFFLIFLLVIAFLQAHFASSLNKGTSVKNGSLPVAVYYLWPVVLAAFPVAVFFFLLRRQYASNGVHCFVPIHSDLFWSFVVPAWLGWFAILIRNQLSITACKQSRPNVDREQLYWARKSVKGIPILISWFLLTFFTALFALDMQLLWLAVLFSLECVLLGPLLFVLHTYNHSKVNNGMFARIELSVYRPCSIRRLAVLAPTSGPPPPPAPPPPPPNLLNPSSRQPPPTVPRHAPPTPKIPSNVAAAPSLVVTPPADPPPPPGTVVPSASSSASSLLRVPPSNVLHHHGPPPPVTSSTQQKMGDERRQPVEKGEDAGGNGGGGGEASAQRFYEWVTDRDERSMGHSQRMLWPQPRGQP